MEQKSIRDGLVEFGLGIVSYVAADAIVTAVKKLEKEGKLNRKEGEKLMHDVVQKYQTASSQYGKDLQSHIDSVMKESIKSSPFATKKDMEAVNAKMDRLLALFNKPTAKESRARIARKKLERKITRGLKRISA